MEYFEVNFDRVAGPTHTTSGLALGNPFAQKNKGTPSSPKTAALQGLEKMKFVHELGVPQAILPPEQRPLLAPLRELGFEGSDEKVIQDSFDKDSELLAACYSASFMWTANMATVSPAADTRDGRLHITPANLLTNFHRSLEAREAHTLLNEIFHDRKYFEVHCPLPAAPEFSDEGAANHARIFRGVGEKGIEIFVYGRNFRDASHPRPSFNPGRQTLESVKALTRHHLLNPEFTIIAQQNPYVIDKGVFHNDVIFASHKNFIMLHEAAFVHWATIEEKLINYFGEENLVIEVIKDSDLTVDEAVETYFFNSQIVTDKEGKMHILSTTQVRENERAKEMMNRIVEKHGFIEDVHFLDVSESLRNGGGPACLRLRMELSAEQWRSLPQGIKFNNDTYSALRELIEKKYPNKIEFEDLKDHKLAKTAWELTDEIRSILSL